MDEQSLDEARPDTGVARAPLSRRRFVGAAGAGLGAAAAVPALVSVVVDDHGAQPIDPKSIDMPPGVVDLTVPVVVHVSNPSTGEVTVFIGDDAHVFTDPELVARVMRSRS